MRLDILLLTQTDINKLAKTFLLLKKIIIDV